MLNFGFWSSLKGMVKVPNLSGLTRTTATQSIIDNGLVAVETGSTTTADNTLNQKIASQDPAFDSLVNYETNVSYTYYNFSFTPYSFVPYSFTPTPYTFTPTPAYTFTPYSFTPYSFTPYSFTPYSFTPIADVSGVWYSYCGNPASGASQYEAYPPEFWANKTCAEVKQFLTQTGEYASGTPWNCAVGTEQGTPTVSAANCGTAPVYTFTPTPYTFTPYSFTPYSFTPSANPLLYYAYCADNGEDSYGDTTGLQSTQSYVSCAALYNAISPTGDIKSSWSCNANSSLVVVPTTCGRPAPYSFTPYSFTPYSFTPTTYTFTPTPAYSFTPYSFTPYSFTPATYSFVPLQVCIDENTLVQVVGYENSVEFKAAKDIILGDKVWSITWDGLLDDLQDPGASTVYPENLENVKRVQSEIVQISPSTKGTTIYFNGDTTKRFTPEEKVLIKRGSSHIFVEAKTVTSLDFIFEATDSGMVATPVSSLDYIEETRNVFKFNAFPVDTIIAGNMVVHNSKI